MRAVPDRGLRSGAILGALVAVFVSLAGCVKIGLLPVDDPPPTDSITQTTDRVPVTFRTGWPQIVRAVEAAVPLCRETNADGGCPEDGPRANFIYRHPGEWEPLNMHMLGRQLGVMASVWRSGPIALTVQRSRLVATIKLQYRTRVGHMDGRQIASCGYGEPPREMTVRFESALRFAPEWFLDPDFKLTITPGERCRVSFLNVDVTDGIIEDATAQFNAVATEAARRIREVTNVRPQAAAIWDRINQPYEVAPAIWFGLNLTGAAVRPPDVTPDGRYLMMKFALSGTPKLTFGRPPENLGAPLPNLANGDISPKFELRVRALMTYDKASKILVHQLNNLPPEVRIPGSRILGGEVTRRGSSIMVSVHVSGLLAGSYHVFGVPRFEAAANGRPGGVLRLDYTGFAANSRSPVTFVGVSMYRQRIERALQDAAHWDVTPELQQATAAFTAALNRDLTPMARLTGDLTRFGPGEVRAGAEGLEAWYQLGGVINVVVNPFD